MAWVEDIINLLIPQIVSEGRLAVFYKRVLEQLDYPAEELLFIDDSQKNVEGAIAAGLPSVYYDPATDLAALLAEVLNDPALAAYGPKIMEGKN